MAVKTRQKLNRIGKLTASDLHRITELNYMGRNLDDIKKRLAGILNTSAKDIEKIFRAAAESDIEFAAHMMDVDAGLVNRTAINRIIEAQVRQTFAAFKNLQRTTVVSKPYKDAVDVAVQTVQGGLTDTHQRYARH